MGIKKEGEMSWRLDEERQERLEPVRIRYAIDRLRDAGFDAKQVSEREVQFDYKGATVRLFPYSGWHSGKTIKDGRGIKKLIQQINQNK